MASALGPNAVEDGLILALDAGNTQSYPGSGTTWTDLIGSNDGTLINAPTFNSANGGSIVFDGTDDYVSVGNLGSFPTQGTISFWMNSSAVENYDNPFSTNYNGGNTGIRFEQTTAGDFYAVIGSDTAGTSGFDGYNLYYYTSGTVDLNENVWYHVVLVWNTSTDNVVGYLNGVSGFSTSHSDWATTLPNVAIGRGFTSRFFTGKIPVVHIYNRALTSTEIEQNYNANKGRYQI